MIKKETVASLKKKADAIVSKYVRNHYADDFGMVACYTCGKVAHVSQMHCGHFVSRNNSATRYDMDNMRVQCPGCNIWGRGRYDVYADKLLTEIGIKKFRDLVKRGRSIHKLSVPELKEIMEKYKL